MSSATQNDKIFQIKITLVGTRPPIWRRILIPADSTFFDLHIAIQDSFGWEDGHLHQFFSTDPFKRGSEYKRIRLPAQLEFEMDDDDNPLDERDEKLSKWYKEPKDAMWYEYDFGDSWMHEIKLEKALEKETKTRYPKLVDGACACPEEDSGGIGGYYHLCEVLKNPKHPDHEDMLDWMELESGDEFDPEEFDPRKVRFRDAKKILQHYGEHFG